MDEASLALAAGEALYRLDGREEESLLHFERAADLGRGSTTGALACLMMGEVLRFLHRQEAALQALEAACHAFDDLDDEVGRCLAEKACAQTLEEAGRLDDALRHLRRGFDCAAGHDYEAAADFLYTTGTILKAQDRRSAAAESFTLAANIYRGLQQMAQANGAQAEVDALDAGSSGQRSAVRCGHCDTPTALEGRFCSSCGRSLDLDGPELPPDLPQQSEQLFVDAEEGDMAFGRSVFMNLVAGAASVANCRFVAWVVSPSGTAEFGSVPFRKEVNVPIEAMSGVYRREAQRALDVLDRHILEDGWRRVASPTAMWYARRYERP